MEQMVISFFNNHNKGYKAFQLLKGGNWEEALPLVQSLNPEETIRIYAQTISDYGATRGEEGILVSLNLRWLPDFYDLKQRAGLMPVLINFGPTLHDPLAQGAGHYTFFIDKEKNLWVTLGEKELGIPAGSNGKYPPEIITDSWLNISKQQDLPLKTIRKFNLLPSDYEIELLFGPETVGGEVQIISGRETTTKLKLQKGEAILKYGFTCRGGETSLRIIPTDGLVQLAAIKIRSVK